MSRKLRSHIRSNAVQLVAVFFVISGTAYATHPGGANTISTVDIINGEVQAADFGTGEVRSVDVVNDASGFALTGTDIANGSLTGTDVLDDSLTNLDLATDSVTGDEVDNGTLTGAEFALNTISGADLAADSVGSDEVEPDAMTAADLGTNSLASDEIGSSAVDASELGAINQNSTTVAVPPLGIGSATATCAEGEQVISGGYRDDLGAQARGAIASFDAHQSFRNGNGWFVRGLSNNTGQSQLTVFAYCLNTP